MKTRSEVTARKLRGGFYTPTALVHFCLERLRSLMPPGDRLRLLEPSAGDGAFIRGVGSDDFFRSRTARIVAIEPFEIEAEKCRKALREAGLRGSVRIESAVRWSVETNERFDGAVGNPPFVRYQFISPDDRGGIEDLGRGLGVPLGGVANLWLPVLASAISRLRDGGAFSFVVPTELLTGTSTAHLRRWLLANAQGLLIDLFPPRSFPDVLQEVAVLSGRRSDTAKGSDAEVEIFDHVSGRRMGWSHRVDPEQPTWTRYLLPPAHLAALEEASSRPVVQRLGSIAKFQVAVVTGANDFFCVTDGQRKEFDLERWARPLLPRLRHAPGIVYDKSDHDRTRAAGARSWLLDFSAERESPTESAVAAKYLQTGIEQGLHKRYKCRIRRPWFRVPHIASGKLLLSKRSHRTPRVIVNRSSVLTTDTIYRGSVFGDSGYSVDQVATSFHTSLTLLSCELEGRSFGGGVLELVPSEIDRLVLAVFSDCEAALPALDAISRAKGEEALVEATDDLLVASGAIDAEVVELLAAARHELMHRRLARNSAAPGRNAAEIVEEGRPAA